MQRIHGDCLSVCVSCEKRTKLLEMQWLHPHSNETSIANRRKTSSQQQQHQQQLQHAHETKMKSQVDSNKQVKMFCLLIHTPIIIIAIFMFSICHFFSERWNYRFARIAVVFTYLPPSSWSSSSSPSLSLPSRSSSSYTPIRCYFFVFGRYHFGVEYSE